MTERKNFIQNILEKPRQIIVDIKTRLEKQEAERLEWWNQYLTTPPAKGQPLTKSYSRSIGPFGRENIQYGWDQKSEKWIEISRNVISGYTDH